MKWPGSTLTDSRSRYHGKNEREGQSGAWAGSASDERSGSDEGNGATVGRRLWLSVASVGGGNAGDPPSLRGWSYGGTSRPDQLPFHQPPLSRRG